MSNEHQAGLIKSWATWLSSVLATSMLISYISGNMPEIRFMSGKSASATTEAANGFSSVITCSDQLTCSRAHLHPPPLQAGRMRIRLRSAKLRPPIPCWWPIPHLVRIIDRLRVPHPCHQISAPSDPAHLFVRSQAFWYWCLDRDRIRASTAYSVLVTWQPMSIKFLDRQLPGDAWRDHAG